MSGRRRNRSEGNPTGTSGGVSGMEPGLDKSSSRSAGGRSSKMLNAKMFCWMVVSSGGMVAAVVATCASALASSSALTNPAAPFWRVTSAVCISDCRLVWRNGDLFLRAAHLNVVQRHFRHQRHLRAVYIFAGGLDGGVVGLKLPPRDAKKIQIPRRPRPGAEGVAGTAAVRLVDRAAAGGRSRSRQRRPQSARILPAGGARLAQQRFGQLHVQIGSERRIDQLGQLRVLKSGPPMGQVNRVVRQARVAAVALMLVTPDQAGGAWVFGGW